MPTIAIYSVKGGVGKTTFSTNLAWCAATISRRNTLLWDLDAAGGAGFVLGVEAKKQRRVDSIFTRKKKPEKLIRPTEYKNLDLLPADDTLWMLDRQFDRIGKRRQLAKITQALSKQYQRIIFDCPPVLNAVSAQVVRAADLVIVPLPPSPLSTRAFDLVVQEVKTNTTSHPPILPVLSMLDMRRTLHRLVREANPSWPAIPMSSDIEQCAVRHAPVGAFAPRSIGARSFARLWTAIERKLASR